MTSASRCVVLAGQQGADLELGDRLGEVDELRLGLGQGVRVVLGLGELEQHGEVVDPATQRLDPVDLALHVGQP